MATHTPEEAAKAELDRLTAAFTKADAELEKTRKPLHAAIVRHQKARSARPSEIADHTPYDRNHVRKVGKDAGVPPLRGPGAGPAPEYDEATAAKALAELDTLTAAYKEAERAVEAAREPLHAAIIRYYSDRTLRPGVIADHTPYDRNHVGVIVREAGAPPIRG